MFLDFDESRPDTPRVPTAMSLREGVLASLVVHLLFVIAILVAPESLFEPADAAEPVIARARPEPLTFIDVMPLRDRSEIPRRPADASDMDRRSATRERAPIPENAMPFSRGNSPEFVERPPPAPPGSPAPTPAPPAPPAPVSESAVALPDMASKVPAPETSAAARDPLAGLREAIRGVKEAIRNDSFLNLQGGDTENAPDIQFDSLGADFGPWLRQFKRRVEGNWIVPPAAMSYRGRVVIQFVVLRNGTIIDLNIVQPAGVPALTTSALNALKLSNPAPQLPPDYPLDRLPITVTFHYNEFYR